MKISSVFRPQEFQQFDGFEKIIYNLLINIINKKYKLITFLIYRRIVRNNMKLLPFCFTLLFSLYSHATYLEIEEDEDIERVYNTIHHFWRDHEQSKKCLENHLVNDDLSLKSEQARESLSHILNSRSELVKLAKKQKREFLKDLNSDLDYIVKNRELVAALLLKEEKDYDVFYHELLLLKLVFLSLI